MVFLPFLGEEQIGELAGLYGAADFTSDLPARRVPECNCARRWLAALPASSGRVPTEIGGGFPLVLAIESPLVAGTAVAALAGGCASAGQFRTGRSCAGFQLGRHLCRLCGLLGKPPTDCFMKPSASLSILHVVGSLNHNWGLSLYVAELAAELASQGHRTQIVCPPGNASEQWPAGEAEVVYAISPEARVGSQRCTVLTCFMCMGCGSLLSSGFGCGPPSQLSSSAFGAWHAGPGALQFSQWKKRLALWLYQRKDLRHATALHATASTELQTLQDLWLDSTDRHASPGVRLPVAEPKPLPADAPRRALFLGRIHPKKGFCR